MDASIPHQAGSFSRHWRALIGDDFDFRIWLITVPAVALAVVTAPIIRFYSQHPWMDRMATFVVMVALATLYSMAVVKIAGRAAGRSGLSNVLLSCWWIGAGAAVWFQAGWMAAVAGGSGAAVILHLMVRQLGAVRLPDVVGELIPRG